MDFTVELSKSFSLSPFAILEANKDHVIMLINYFNEKGQTSNNSAAGSQKKENKRGSGKNERIRVNDKTATGGWF